MGGKPQSVEPTLRSPTTAQHIRTRVPANTAAKQRGRAVAPQPSSVGHTTPTNKHPTPPTMPRQHSTTHTQEPVRTTMEHYCLNAILPGHEHVQHVLTRCSRWVPRPRSPTASTAASPPPPFSSICPRGPNALSPSIIRPDRKQLEFLLALPCPLSSPSVAKRRPLPPPTTTAAVSSTAGVDSDADGTARVGSASSALKIASGGAQLKKA